MSKKYLFYIIVFLHIFSCPLYCQESKKENLYREANELLSEYSGQTDQILQAQEKLNEILKIDQNYALAYVGLARAEYKLGYINYTNYDQKSLLKARQLVFKALEINPNLFEAHLANSYIYLFQKDLANAKQSMLKAKTIKPDDMRIVIFEAELAQKEKDYETAIQKAKQCIAASSDKKILSDAYSILHGIYRYKKEYDLADKYYQEELKLDPDSPWVNSNYSNFLIETGNYDKAIEYGKRSLSLMDFGMGHYVLSNAYYKKAYDLCWNKKDYYEAEKYFTLSIEEYPNNANVYYGLGICYRFISYDKKDKGLLKKSEEALKKAIQLKPDHELAKKELEKHYQWINKK